jgi:hypothetical protein
LLALGTWFNEVRTCTCLAEAVLYPLVLGTGIEYPEAVSFSSYRNLDIDKTSKVAFAIAQCKPLHIR